MIFNEETVGGREIVIEVFKIVHNVYDNRAAPLLSYYDSMLLEVTSLSYKIIVLIIILENFSFLQES